MTTKSKKPGKQRQFQRNRPRRQKAKALAARLAEKLATEFARRNVPVRKGDDVLVFRGPHKGKKGKIMRVDYDRPGVTIEKIVRKKSDGTEVPVWFDTSKLVVLDVHRTDAKRTLSMSGNKR